MSRKMTKSNLSRDEISLLINSEEAKDTKLYGNLYEILLQIKELKAITLEELETYNLNYNGLSALSYNKRTLIDNATKEWRATTDIIDNPKRDARCQLCNAPKLRYECHIRNIKNNIELLVGSECVNKFKIDGYLNQKKQLAQIHKGHQIVQRRNEFNKYFPDYEAFISDAQKYFSTLPILLPYELYINLKSTIERMRLIAIKYINEGKKPFNSQYDSFELFRLAIKNYNRLKTDSESHVNKNINQKLVCKRSEIDWLISQNKMILLQQISENDGIYTLSTLKNMYSVSFVKRYMNLIITKNHSEIVKFERFNESSLIFSFFKFGYQPPILFTLHLKDFVQHIGANCIYDDNFTYSSKDILAISNIIDSKRNLSSILGYIDGMMVLLNCVFLVDDSTNSLFLYRKGDKAIRQFSKYAFMEAYSRSMLLSDNEIKKYLISIVKGNNNIKWATPEIQAKQGIDDKIKILYKGYKDSHEYSIRPTGRKFELIAYSVSNNPTLNVTKVDFDSSEYISLKRNMLNISDSQLRSVDYGLYINDDSLNPLYKNGDILLIQSIQKFKNEATIFFASNDGILIRNCHSDSEEPESIFNFINIPKKELIAYGKIIYCLHKTESSFATSSQKDTVCKEVKIFVVNNPKQCFECSSKCVYKLINYKQDNKESRKINVAVCPRCEKYYIDQNTYLSYTRSKKKTNMAFILPEKLC